MIARHAFHIARLIAPILIMAQVTISDETVWDSNLGNSQRFVSVGQLARMGMGAKDKNRFVLLNQYGDIISSLRPVPGLALEQYLGQEVGVTVRTLVDGDVPILSAESVTSFGEAEQLAASASHIQHASYEDSLVASHGIIPEGTAVLPGMETPYGVGAPIMDSEYLGGPACGGNCGNLNCNQCVACPCGPPGRMWLRAEYLLWWTDGMHTPALVTTSPAGTPRNMAGVIGQGGTQVLFGDQDLFDETRNGGRFRLGKWCDTCQWMGFETDFFFLAEEHDDYRTNSMGNQILARPFFNTQRPGGGAQDAELIQFPGVIIGSAAVDSSTTLWSIGPRLRVNLACERIANCNLCDARAPGGYRLDMLVGYRYARLADKLSIREDLSTVDPNNQTVFSLQDTFNTSNDFHGADLGILWEGYRGPWSLELIGRAGLGNTRQKVAIDGSTTATGRGTTVTDPGGILALSSNMGSYSRDEFTVLPEFGATMGYSVSPRTRLLVGYTFLYWNNVVRAGDQVDLNVNPDLIPPPLPTTGPNSPAFAFVDSSFWAQGLSFGLDYRW